jgi:hypothetical protein
MPEIVRAASAMSNEPSFFFWLLHYCTVRKSCGSLVCVRDSMITILYDTIEFGWSGDETIECVEGERGAYESKRWKKEMR